jgi:nicotinamide-nucleotide amidase
LAAVGIDIAGHITVPDSREAIAAAIRHSAEMVDLLVVSGGLGPTEDDLTREGLADAMGVELVKDEAALATIRGFFDQLKRPMPPRNEVQAYLPRGARSIPNSCGTAPGIAAVIERPGQSRAGGKDGAVGCRVVVMPGVPKEMFAMWRLSVLPELQKLAGGAVILSRTLHTFGLGESTVAQRLGTLMDRTRNPSVGTTVSQGIVSLRLNVRAPDAATAKAELDATHRACVDAMGLLIFGQDDETLTHVVARMLRGEKCGDGRTVRLATAESCTGGLLAKMLTDEPGSSAFLAYGFIAYANEAKTQLLGVETELIERHGAVSEAVASAMARGALERTSADLALSITGIAGPDGGTPTKPVGTVCIALAWRSPSAEAVVSARTFQFPGDREMIRDRSAKMALSLLRYHLLKQPCPF